jgi:hypothetical protein
VGATPTGSRSSRKHRTLMEATKWLKPHELVPALWTGRPKACSGQFDTLRTSYGTILPLCS